MFTNMYRNQNGCGSHKNVTKKDKLTIRSLIIKEEVGIKNDFIRMNSNSFIFSL